MIGIVVAEGLAGMRCPLTVWEGQLRKSAGQITYAGDFIGYWTNRLLFFQAPRWVFTVCYAVFGLAVLAALDPGAASPAGARPGPAADHARLSH